MQNNTLQATQPNTLKAAAPTTISIDTVIERKETVKIEITLPCFRKNGNDYYFFESPEKCTRVTNYEPIDTVVIESGPAKRFYSFAATGEEITEEEFKNILTYAMTFIMSDKAA